MISINERTWPTKKPAASLTLPFESRQKSRLRVTLDNGEEAGLFLPRGTLLRGGDCLLAEDGRVILVNAAAESTSTAYSSDPLLLMKACYHLGNRHIPVQIGENFVRYQHDHVLDDMIAAFGLGVKHELAPFEPESGAYHSHNHGAHHHSHSHDN
ncbi:MAG: urease accessory protein UreE [Methylobacter sp.]